LHPKRFSQDVNIRQVMGMKSDTHFSILRFVSMKATHDFKQKGLTYKNKLDLVELLSKFGEILISSEGDLPENLHKYKIILPPDKMHDLLAEADLFVGEGATMASECAMIGTPAIYINSLEAGTIDDQEKNGLLFHFRDFTGVLQKANELLLKINLKEDFKDKRNNMLKNKIDLTSFLIWFVECYPESKGIMINNPDYQYNFR
jgi:uncharacterized protein